MIIPPYGRHVLALFGVIVTACASDPIDCSPAWETWTTSDLDGSLLRCDVVPELCDLPVASTIREPDLATAIDVVFVGDGFTAKTIASYRQHVATLIDEVTEDESGIVHRDPTLFNFHRVDVVASSPAEPRPLRTCTESDGPITSLMWSSDGLRIARAAANAPEVDLVVMIAAAGTDAQPNTTEDLGHVPIFMMRIEDPHGVMTYGIGRTLVGLADESVRTGAPHPLADQYARWTSSPLPPNLSLSADGDWPALVDGAVEGGDKYGRGVYHPTDRCRMGHPDGTLVEFCPVCSAAIDRALAGRRASAMPRCGIALMRADAKRPETASPAGEIRRYLFDESVGPEDGWSDSSHFVIFGRDESGWHSVQVRIDGALLLGQLFPIASTPRVVPVYEAVVMAKARDDVRAIFTDMHHARCEALLRL